MADHHAVDCWGKVAKDGEFMLLHEFPGAFDAGEFVVGIEPCRGVAGEMLAAAENTGGPQRIVESRRFFNDLGDIAPIAAAAKRVVGLIVKGDVQHGTEVQVEAENSKDAACDIAVSADQIQIPGVAELLGAGRLVPDTCEAGHATAFLVDRDDRLHAAQIPEVVDEFAQLLGSLDVATEENESSRLDLAEEARGIGIEFRAGNANKKKLTGILRWHREGQTRFDTGCRNDFFRKNRFVWREWNALGFVESFSRALLYDSSLSMEVPIFVCGMHSELRTPTPSQD